MDANTHHALTLGQLLLIWQQTLRWADVGDKYVGEVKVSKEAQKKDLTFDSKPVDKQSDKTAKEASIKEMKKSGFLQPDNS